MFVAILTRRHQQIRKRLSVEYGPLNPLSSALVYDDKKESQGAAKRRG